MRRAIWIIGIAALVVAMGADQAAAQVIIKSTSNDNDPVALYRCGVTARTTAENGIPLT